MTLGTRQIYQEPQKPDLLLTDFFVVDDNTVKHNTFKVTGTQVAAMVLEEFGPYAGFFYVSAIPPAVQMVTNTGYRVTGEELATLTLPLISEAGDVLEILNTGTSTFIIAQNSSQFIDAGTNETTVGVGGSLSCTAIGDALRLVCTVANTSWQVVSSIGNFNGV